MRRPARFFIISAILFCCPQNPSSAQDYNKIFRTKYTTIHYERDEDIGNFTWRLGGQRLELPQDTALANSRIDKVIERVEAILDMQPKNFNVDIYLHRGKLEPNRVAYYENRAKSIHISIENSSDGVLAHEIAHAIVNQHFSVPPPSKVQEILTQYVDKYLWSDY